MSRAPGGPSAAAAPGSGGTPTEAPDEAVKVAVRALFGRDSVYMLVWALQLLAAAALTPVMTRVLAADEFGAVASAMAVMQVLFALAGLGLQTAIQRWFADRGADEARRLLMVGLLLAVAVTVVADATGWWWSRYLGFDDYSVTLRLAVYWAGASAVTHCALGLLRSQDRLLMFGCVGVLQSVAAETMSLVLILAGRPTATMFVLGRLLAQLGALALALAVTRPKMLRWRDRSVAVTGLAFALPLVPAELSTFVLNTADRLIVGGELGLTAVARYQIAYNVGAIPMILITILNVAWMPRIFALDAGRQRAAVLAMSRDALYAVLMPVIIGLSIGMPLILRLWAPAQYRPDALLLVAAVVVVSVVPYTAGLSLTRGLLAQGHSAPVAVATVVAAVANVALNVVLVPPFGLTGCAGATFCAYVVLHAVLLSRSRVVAPTPGPGPVLLLKLGAAVLVALFASGVPTSPAFLLLRAVLALAALGWLGRILLRLSSRRPPTGADGRAVAGREYAMSDKRPEM